MIFQFMDGRPGANPDWTGNVILLMLFWGVGGGRTEPLWVSSSTALFIHIHIDTTHLHEDEPAPAERPRNDRRH